MSRTSLETTAHATETYQPKGSYASQEQIYIINTNILSVNEKVTESINDIDALQLLTKGIGGGGVNGDDLAAGGRFNLVPNTILLCLSPEKSKLNLKGTDYVGNTVDYTGLTAILLFATVLSGNKQYFNVCGVAIGGSSVLSLTNESFRYAVNPNSPLYIENTGSISAGLYRDVRE